MKRLIISAVALLVAGAAAAQNYLEDPRYGATPEERTENAKLLSYLKFEMDSKGYDRAAGYIKQLMDKTPKATANIYIYGATVYKNKAARAKSLEEKKAFVDSIMLIHDRRAEHFGDNPTRGTAYILGQKARDYVSLNPMDREGVRANYKAAVDAAEAVEVALVLEYFQQLVEDFKSVTIESDELIDEYNRLTPMMVAATDEQRDTFNNLFASSGAANCDTIEELYRGMIAGDPNNSELIAKAYNLMSMVKCTSDFYVEVAEKYYAQSPSSQVAVRLASVLDGRGEFDKSLKYLNEMLASETDPKEKALLYLQIGGTDLELRRGSAAAAAARQVIALEPSNGYGYMLLAEAYVNGANSCSGFHAQTVYWLAYDQFARARQAFEAAGQSAEVRAAEERMGNCRAGFPSFEDGFMYVEGYADGKSYTVNCGWVSGTTTIRSR